MTTNTLICAGHQTVILKISPRKHAHHLEVPLTSMTADIDLIDLKREECSSKVKQLQCNSRNLMKTNMSESCQETQVLI